MPYVNLKFPLCAAVFTAQGIKPDLTKVQALQDLPAPENAKQLQSFLAQLKVFNCTIPVTLSLVVVVAVATAVLALM